MEKTYKPDLVAEICNEIEKILYLHQDVLVPVKEILHLLKQKSGYEDINYDELANWLKNDSRFEFIFIPERIEQDEDSPVILQSVEKVEELGFYSGSRVKLKNANLDVEKIVEILNRKVDVMMDVLVNIWDKRPAGDPNIEDNLLDILARAQKLQREVKSVINPDNIKPLTDYLESNDSKKPDLPT